MGVMGISSIPSIVDACLRLLEDEVRRKRGVSGLAVKAGFKVLKAFKPGAVRNAIDAMFDEFIEALEPHYADFEGDGAKGTFGGFMKTRSGGIAEDLVRRGFCVQSKDSHTWFTPVKGLDAGVILDEFEQAIDDKLVPPIPASTVLKMAENVRDLAKPPTPAVNAFRA